MADKLKIFLSMEELQRFKFTSEKTIIIDLHGLTRKEMIRMVKNVSAVCGKGMVLILIHGYNHGITLLQTIRKKEIPIKKEYKISTCPYNIGITYLEFI